MSTRAERIRRKHPTADAAAASASLIPAPPSAAVAPESHHSFDAIAVVDPGPQEASLDTRDAASDEERAAHVAVEPTLRAGGGIVQRAPGPDAPPPDRGSPPDAPPPADPQSGASASGSTTFKLVPSARDISAGNLTALWTNMTNSGTRESASVLPKLMPAPQYEYDANDIVKKVDVNVVETKEMPKWLELDAQCEPIKNEWNRFFSVLDAHENRHVAIDRKHFEGLHLKLVGKKKEAAWKAADDAVDAANTENETYDNSTQHGVTEGANLNAAVQCAPEKVKSSSASEPGSDRQPASDVPPFQAKLEVSQPGDPYEVEADRVADQVMREGTSSDSASVGTGRVSRTIQRCSGCGGEERRLTDILTPSNEETPPHKCAKCEAEEKMRRAARLTQWPLQRKDADVNRGVDTVSAVAAASQSSGEPLDTETRAFMEPRFGFDFGRVRIHADPHAAEAARYVNARAYTLGSDIVFASGEYTPSSTEGRRLLAHELTHVLQQTADQHSGSLLRASGIVQRDGPTAAPAPPAPAAPAASPAPDATAALIEQEKEAFKLASGRVGQKAATVWFHHCPEPSQEKKETENFTIQSLARRPTGDPDRLGFDAEGPATAFASLQGGDGSVVLKQEQFYFIGRLSAGQHVLQRATPDTVKDERSMWAVAAKSVALSLVNPVLGVASVIRDVSDAVREAAATRPSGARYVEFGDSIVAVVGRDGTRFPKAACLLANEDALPLMPTTSPDPKTGLPVPRTDVPEPPEAKDLRAIAGIPDEGKKAADAPKGLDQVAIPPEQQDQFILSYFRARGAEALASNEATVEKLAEQFAPTSEGTKEKAGSGVSSAAKSLIDAGRELGVNFEKLLDQEATLNARLQDMTADLMRRRGNRIPEEKLVFEVKGEKKHLDQWIAQAKKDQDIVTSQKNETLSKSPVLALLVERQTPSSRVITPIAGSGTRQASVSENSNPYTRSLLAKPPTPEGDEEIRKQFNVKLDGVRKAIRHARSQMLTKDIQYLMGMEGLRARIEADFQGLGAKNEGLKPRLKTLLQQRDINHETFEIGTMVIQVGLMFVPGGQVLSAAMGFAMAVQGMSENMARWDVSKATVDPAKALVDQQQAESALLFSTLVLAISAVDLATSVNQALGVGEGISKLTSGHPTEIHGIPDAYESGALHELKSGQFGPERCSNHCMLFGQSLGERGKFLQKTAGGAEERVKQRAMYLQARGDSISVRGKALAELSASERAAKESALLNEAYEVEMQMVEIEQEAMGIAGNRLPASYKGTWSNPAQPGTGRWFPNPDHPAYKYCGKNGIPYHNGYPNFSELALPGGEINLLPGKKVVVNGVEQDVAMVGKMSDFEMADALAAQQTGMKDATTFSEWRLNRGYTWHHRENGVTMQLVPTELHASIPHIGGASLQRGVRVP
jgi:hypothetical protein